MNFADPTVTQLERPDLSVDLERLRRSGIDYFLIAGAVLWMIYMVNGFRLPTQEIVLSDKDAGAAIRQVIFAGCGMLALWRFIVTRTLGAVCMINWKITLLAAFLVLSALWSERSGLTLKRSIIFVFGYMTLAYFIHFSNRPVRFMIRMIVLFAGAAAVFSLVFYFVLPKACTVNPGRPGLAGISIHPNTLSPFLSIGLLLSFAYEVHSKKGKLLVRILQGIFVIDLILANSMTSIVTTLIGGCLYLFLISDSYRKGSIKIFATIMTGLLLLVGISTVKSAFFDAAGRDESLSGRDELWVSVLYEAQKKPIVGHGFGAFWVEGKGRELVQTWNPRQSHHAYLDILLDLGIVGLVVVLSMFPLSLLLQWRCVRGSTGSWQRKAMAAMMAVAFSYMAFYALGQSFFLRMDAFPFFVLLWIVMLVSNKDNNLVVREFTFEYKNENRSVS